MDFDLVLAGGGLANGLVALRLAVLRPEVRVAIVEAGTAVGGRRPDVRVEAQRQHRQPARDKEIADGDDGRHASSGEEEGGDHRPILAEPVRGVTPPVAAYDVAGPSANSVRAQAPARQAPTSCAAMNGRVSTGRMPAKLSVSARAKVIAGLAKLVEAVNQ